MPDVYSRGVISSQELNRVPWDVIYIIPETSVERIGLMFRTAIVVRPGPKLISAIAEKIHYGRMPKRVHLFYDIQRTYLQGLRDKTHVVVIPTFIREERIQYLFSRYSRKCKNLRVPAELGSFDLVHDGKRCSVCEFCSRSPYLLTGECKPGTKECIQSYSI